MIWDHLPHTVTILKASTSTDAYGNPSTDWDAAHEQHVAGWLQAGASSETHSNARDVVESSYRLFLRPGTDLSARDRVRIDGVTYRVDGEPRTPRTLLRTAYTSARLVRLEG